VRRLLLLSNSTCHGRGLLDHAEAELGDFLAGVSRVLFVPHALADREGYARTISGRLAAMGFRVDSLATAGDKAAAVSRAEALLIGGGNTFRLLSALYELGLVEVIRRRVLAEGMPYVGSSAGTNVATLSIRTTNDMPIVEPPSFTALGLVCLNINPHYLDPPKGSTHMGETREQRIREFHEENDPPVLGLREGTWLRVEGDHLRVGGEAVASPWPARLFQKGLEPRELQAGETVEEWRGEE